MAAQGQQQYRGWELVADLLPDAVQCLLPQCDRARTIRGRQDVAHLGPANAPNRRRPEVVHKLAVPAASRLLSPHKHLPILPAACDRAACRAQPRRPRNIPNPVRVPRKGLLLRPHAV
eukprot:365617-Chlamydomonas_euryale.AAC.17